MHDGRQYDPIQDQGHGGWQMTTDSQIRAQYLKLIGSGFLIFVIVFVSRDLKLAVSIEVDRG